MVHYQVVDFQKLFRTKDKNFVSRLCRDFNIMYFLFLMPAPPKSPPKNQEAREAKFCEILSPTPPAFCKISLAFRICISAHHIIFKRLRGVQSVLPHFCFSRSTTRSVVALQRAGNASDYDFEKMFELGTIETPLI